MQLVLPFEVVLLANKLTEAGFESFLVGGAVRDLLLRQIREPHATTALTTDYDLTTNATPEQIMALFPESYYENDFGTVSLTHADWLTQLQQEQWQLPANNMQTQLTAIQQQTSVKNRLIDLVNATKIHISLKPTPTTDDFENSVPTTVSPLLVHPFEITTYRAEGDYTDHRRPNTVSWGKTIKEDLTRRDFTVNAIALELRSVSLLVKNALRNSSTALPTHFSLTEADYHLVDPHQGLKDLHEGILQTVGNPADRFAEDALRMLRAIRLSAQLDLAISDATFQAIVDQSELLANISAERVRDELLKMLSSNRPKQAIELLDETNLLQFVLPELLDAKGVQQGGHHTTDVWTHSLDALASCPATDPIVRLATLIHDIAKPYTYDTSQGTITFYNHEIIGSRVASKIGRRLRLSKRDTDRLFLLVRHHMFYYQPENTDASIRRFMRKVGLEHIDDILDLREADRLGSGAHKTSWRLEEFKQRMIEQLNQPLDVTDLAINGTDLMEQLELKPGPILGKLLHELFELVMEEPELNTREQLLARAKLLLEELR
jgi:tRNA nucleotidyltransferase (CCA-adding enzyme)